MDIKKLLQSLTDPNTYPNSVGLMSMPNAGDAAPALTPAEQDEELKARIPEWRDVFKPPTIPPTTKATIKTPEAAQEKLPQETPPQTELEAKEELAPTLKVQDSLLDRLTVAQKKESDDMDSIAIGKALTMLGTGLGGRGYTTPDFTLLDEFAKKVGKDKRDIKEQASLKEQEQKLGMEIARTQDQLANSASDRATEDIVRKQKAMESEMAGLKLRQEQLSHAPDSGMSTAARSFYGQQLERIGMKDMANLIQTQKMSQAQIEDILGKNNLQSLVSQFDATQARKELKQVESTLKQEGVEAKKQEKVGAIEDMLRKEASAMDQKVKFSDLKAHMETLGEQLKQPNGVVDVALLYNFMKSLDPESVVRESEIDLTLKASSPLAKAFNLPKKFTKGDILPPETRAKMVSYMQSELAAKAKLMGARLAPHINRAEKAGADLSSVLPTDVLNSVVKKQELPTATSSKVRVRLPDGRTGTIPKEKLQDALAKGAKEIK